MVGSICRVQQVDFSNWRATGGNNLRYRFEHVEQDNPETDNGAYSPNNHKPWCITYYPKITGVSPD